MTFSTRVRSELFSMELDEHIDYTTDQTFSPKLIRLPQTRPFGTCSNKTKTKIAKTVPDTTLDSTELEDCKKSARHGLAWTTEEHNRFLQALETYPSGPWKDVASFVGTRTPRQVMTHAQKYREKIQRRRRGLLTSGKSLCRPAIYRDLAITTTSSGLEPILSSTDDKSPTTVDVHPGLVEDPHQSNWIDGVSVENMDAAFNAVLAHTDSTLFPVGDEEFYPIASVTQDEWGNIVEDDIGVEA